MAPHVDVWAVNEPCMGAMSRARSGHAIENMTTQTSRPGASPWLQLANGPPSTVRKPDRIDMLKAQPAGAQNIDVTTVPERESVQLTIYNS